MLLGTTVVAADSPGSRFALLVGIVVVLVVLGAIGFAIVALAPYLAPVAGVVGVVLGVLAFVFQSGELAVGAVVAIGIAVVLALVGINEGTL